LKLQILSFGEITMQTFHIRYRNTQGTLMRILNAASRRALEMPSVHAEPAEQDHQVTLQLEVTPRQVGQLHREWYSIVDVLEVRSSPDLHTAKVTVDLPAAWTLPHPPVSAPGTTEESNSARA
jgi:acetolactate synthase small subunit